MTDRIRRPDTLFVARSIRSSCDSSPSLSCRSSESTSWLAVVPSPEETPDEVCPGAASSWAASFAARGDRPPFAGTLGVMVCLRALGVMARDSRGVRVRGREGSVKEMSVLKPETAGPSSEKAPPDIVRARAGCEAMMQCKNEVEKQEVGHASQ